jgi:hypothetical protein
LGTLFAISNSAHPSLSSDDIPGMRVLAPADSGALFKISAIGFANSQQQIPIRQGGVQFLYK